MLPRSGSRARIRRLREQLRHVVARAREGDHVLQLEPAYLRLDGRAVRAVADEERGEWPVANPGERADERQGVLGLREAPDGHDQRRTSVMAGLRDGVDVDGVRDHHGPLRDAGARGEPGRPLALGDADRDGRQRGHQAVRPPVEH